METAAVKLIVELEIKPANAICIKNAVISNKVSELLPRKKGFDLMQI